MYKLYIGYITGLVKVDKKTYAMANQGWSAEVSGFTSIKEAITWANYKLINISKIKHYWFWIYDCRTFENKLVYVNDKIKIEKVSQIFNEKHLTIKEYGKIEKKSLFPKLVNWSTIEGITMFNSFKNSMLSGWKKITGKVIVQEDI
jgi:hypothetical protein